MTKIYHLSTSCGRSSPEWNLLWNFPRREIQFLIKKKVCFQPSLFSEVLSHTVGCVLFDGKKARHGRHSDILLLTISVFLNSLSVYMFLFLLCLRYFQSSECYITVSPLKLQTGSRRHEGETIGNALALIECNCSFLLPAQIKFLR